MPVNVPRLKRVQPASDLPKNDRLNFQVKDQASNILGRTKAITDLGKEGTDLYLDIEDSKIEVMSAENEQSFRQWDAAEKAKLQSVEGDPTGPYEEYNKKVSEKVQEILGSRKDISDRAKSKLASKFENTVRSNQLDTLKQRGKQQDVYENNLYESTLKSKKSDLAKSTGHIKAGDNSSYIPFNLLIKDIKETITNRGLRNGTVTKDKNGKPIHSQISKQRMAKELSEGVTSAVNVLIDTGDSKAAMELRKKYQNYIDPVNNAKIEKKAKTDDLKSRAYEVVNSLRGKDIDAQLDHIESIEDGELRGEVLKIKDSNDRRRDSMRKRQSNRNYETLANKVIAKQETENPYHGIAELENDPLYKQTWDKINTKQKQALIEMFKPPKESKPVSEAKIQDLIFGNNPNHRIETITPTKFNEFLTGLSKTARNKYSSLYVKLRMETSSEQRANHERAGKFLTDFLIKAGKIDRGKFGEFDSDEQDMLIDGRLELIDHLSAQIGVKSDKDLKDFVKEYVAHKIENPKTAFKPSGTKKSAGGGTLEGLKLDKEQVQDLMFKFKRKHKRLPNMRSPEFIKFAEENR